jgi:HAD superfamily hydrolase (TIGR01509 family)
MDSQTTAVLFDVDGTLVDSNYLHVTAWWEAFNQSGHQVPMKRIHRAIGMGSDLLLDHLLPGDRDRSADDRISNAHEALYATYWPRLAPLPGAADLLRACADRGLTVVLASSASQRELAVMREALGAEDAIDAATSSAAVQSSKPAPDLVRVALDRAGADPRQALFVGDTVWDLQACEKAGVRCIALLSGGIGRDELSGAIAIYDDPADLMRHLDEVFRR